MKRIFSQFNTILILIFSSVFLIFLFTFYNFFFSFLCWSLFKVQVYAQLNLHIKLSPWLNAKKKKKECLMSSVQYLFFCHCCAVKKLNDRLKSAAVKKSQEWGQTELENEKEKKIKKCLQKGITKTELNLTILSINYTYYGTLYNNNSKNFKKI